MVQDELFYSSALRARGLLIDDYISIAQLTTRKLYVEGLCHATFRDFRMCPASDVPGPTRSTPASSGLLKGSRGVQSSYHCMW